MIEEVLFSKLNVLSQKVISAASLSQVTILTEETIRNWSERSGALCSEFTALESNDEKEDWLRTLFIELFDFINKGDENSPLKLSDIALFIEELVGCDRQVPQASIVGKMFIAVSSTIPNINDSNTISLCKLVPSLHDELFKFSWISSKLLNKEQTTLLRHLLKKSKYELKKYNLLVENSVGYSQLVTLLILAYYDPDNSSKTSAYVKEIYHIMGKYSLDSIRTLDVILNVSNQFITEGYEFFVALLQKSDFWPSNHVADNTNYSTLNKGGNMIAANIISFNLSQCKEQVDKENYQRYMDMCCILIRMGFVNFYSIWDNVTPEMECLQKYTQDLDTELEAESTKGIENPLAMAAALSTENENDENDAPANDNDDDKDKDGDTKNDETDLKDKQKIFQQKLLSFGKIKLLERLLIHGCIVPAIHVLKQYPSLLYVNESIPKYFGRIFEYLLDPLYTSMTPHDESDNMESALMITRIDNGILAHKPRLIHQYKTHDPFESLELNTRYVFYYSEWNSALTPFTSVDDLFEKSHIYLSTIGPFLAKIPTLLSKISRIGVADIQKKQDSESLQNTVDNWVDYVRKFIFPATPLLQNNPIATSEVYELMKLFPFEKRYFIYNEMMTKLSQDNLQLKVSFNKAEREAKSVLKALSIDTIAKESRRFAKLISTNPLATLVPAVKQIENYDKVSELVVYTTKYFNDFAYDVLQFVLLLRLTYNRPAVQFDGVNQAMWVQRLSIFIGGLAKKCPNMDISNIITYILKTLHNGNIIAVSILKELIITVGGIRDLNEVNVKQLSMLNSGKPLRQYARHLIYDFRDDNFDIASRLTSFFTDQNAISEIILLLYTLNVKANTQDSHYKILSTRCDEMNTLLWSFIELIKHCLKTEAFEENVLPFAELTNRFHLSTPWVFHIWRDYLDNQLNANEDSSIERLIEGAKFNDVDLTNISKDLFTTFWRLSLYDIHFDKSLYDERKKILSGENMDQMSNRKKHLTQNQIKDILVTGISHQRAFKKTVESVSQKSTIWNKDCGENQIKVFLQNCVVPRVLFSPSDALFSSHFIFMAFSIENLILILNTFITSDILKTLLFCCTSSEAGNLGLFFTNVLKKLEEMRLNGDFDSQASRKLYEWHSVITDQIIDLLSEKNYMSIRNGIEFMKHVTSVFPIVKTHIQLVYTTLEENLVHEEREDIKLPSSALIGHLKARLKNALELDEFCSLTEQEAEEKKTYQMELEEIKNYQTAYQNEQKQVALRKQLELNKSQRLQNDLSKSATSDTTEPNTKETWTYSCNEPSIPTKPSSSQWSYSKVTRHLDDINHYLATNHLQKAVSLVENDNETWNLKKLSKQNMPIFDFRNLTLEIFERYFRSLIQNPQNPDFAEKIDALKRHIKNISREPYTGAVHSGTSAPEYTKRSSRYGGNSSKDTYASANHKAPSSDRSGLKNSKTSNSYSHKRPELPTRPSKGKVYNDRSRTGRPTGPDRGENFDRQRENRSREDYKKTNSQRSQLRFPEKPSQEIKDNNKATSYQSSSYKRDMPLENDEKSNKRFKKDDGNRNKFQQQDYRSTRESGSNRRSNEGQRYNTTRKSNTQALPQGPKGANYVSRYQK
ncbi:rlr1p [Saccharomyces arboricola H-6]|uniref:THO complex subunit 2 n=1 Tax=Saccharomyces arboricola (strain H-6 / AS 2.3317 / CBS 10644) TaxID=1160507 RepID=J8Q316_SACAR|nr:rlr1p [Saccharomyces arboricola H-6]